MKEEPRHEFKQGGLKPDAAVIEDGFTMSERAVADAEGDVADWLEGLGVAEKQ